MYAFVSMLVCVRVPAYVSAHVYEHVYKLVLSVYPSLQKKVTALVPAIRFKQPALRLAGAPTGASHRPRQNIEW